MKVLVDTHALLWWLFADRRLSRKAKAVLRDPATAVAVSSASAWEIATKYRLGRLDAARPLVDDFSAWIARAGFIEWPMTFKHAIVAGQWDRMLAAQSKLEELRLLSRDPIFADFGVDTVW